MRSPPATAFASGCGSKPITRRRFIKRSSQASAAIAAGSAVLGFPAIARAQSPGDQLVLAFIGAGRRASSHVGYPQREAIFALPKMTVPKVMDVTCPPVPDAGGCACDRERCGGNFGWDGMHPALKIGEDDLRPDTQAEGYAICQK